MLKSYKIKNEISRLIDLKDNIDFILESLNLKVEKIESVEPPVACEDIKEENISKLEAGDLKTLESRIYDFISEKSKEVEVDLRYGDTLPYRD